MQERLVLKKSVKKMLGIIILVLIGMIMMKQNPGLKEEIKQTLYEKSLPMMALRQKYNQYFSWNEEKKVQSVMVETISFKRKEKTKTGVKLIVNTEQSIPLLESGMIVLVESNNIVVEQIDGVTATYSNIKTNQYKLYDYIEKGEILGVASEEDIYISFLKEGNYYDYKHYL